MVEPVPIEQLSHSTVVDCGDVEFAPGDSSVISAIVEKPAAKDAPSNLALLGLHGPPLSSNSISYNKKI